MDGSSRDAWNDVAAHFTDLGHRLAERYREQAEPGEAAEESRRKVEEAVRSVTQQLDRAFTAIGDTIRDPAAKDSLDKAVGSLGTALSGTFSELGEEIRTKLGPKGSSSQSSS